jgi:hypothetical protein
VVLTLKEKFGEISPLRDKNKVARNQTNIFWKKIAQSFDMSRKRKM